MKIIPILLFTLCLPFTFIAQSQSQKPEIGIADYIANDDIIAEAGLCCQVESIGRLVSPRTVSDEAFKQNLLIFKQLKTPIYAFNIFFPGDLKLVGPEVNETAILDYVEIILKRISQSDTKLIIWGSGGARRLPDGFDKKLAIKQFISIAKKIAKKAENYNITIALENLNSTETNFINTAKEALYVVKKVNHPNLRLNVDIYHMLKENEAPAIIKKTKKYIYHVEIAEKDKRTAPGVVGTDFRPYLAELAKIGYSNKIVIEGNWKHVGDIAKMTKAYLQTQINETFK
jgi:sugar phosphate isomerase/epimerase